METRKGFEEADVLGVGHEGNYEGGEGGFEDGWGVGFGVEKVDKESHVALHGEEPSAGWMQE